ncbi:MAG: molybdopterin-dependent oxidoreductase [Methanobacterium formicicum]
MLKKTLKEMFKWNSKTNLDDETVESILKDENIVISPDTQREVRIPPGQHENKRWPVLHAGSVNRVDPSQWKLKIWGLVQKERELDFADFMALPRVQVFSDIHCVTTWSKLNNLWEGVSTSTIKNWWKYSLKPDKSWYTLIKILLPIYPWMISSPVTCYWQPTTMETP